MANLVGGQITVEVLGAPLRIISFSGTVKLSGVGVIRDLIGYRIGSPETVYETTSDSSGNWTLEMQGGSNDFFRIICVGATGENSEIYDNLSG